MKVTCTNDVVPNKKEKMFEAAKAYEALNEDMQVAKYNGAWYDRSGNRVPEIKRGYG